MASDLHMVGAPTSVAAPSGLGGHLLIAAARELGMVDQALIVTDPAGSIVFWNAAAEAIYGRSAAGVTGRNIVEVVTSEAAADEVAQFIGRMRAGEPWEGEFQTRRRDGSKITALVTSTPIFGDGGELAGAAAVLRDITEMRQVEQRLGASQHRFSALIQHSGDLFGVNDAAGVIISVDGPVSAYFGVEADVLVGTSVFELLRPADQERARVVWAQRVATITPMPAEDFWVRRADGTWMCLAVLLSNLLDDPAVGGIVLTARDVTDRKHLEEARRVASGANAVMVRASDEEDLFSEICKLIISDVTYDLAWIGRADAARPLGVRMIALAEHSTDTFAGTFAAREHLVEDDTYRGPLSLALETREPQVVQDVEALPETVSWRRLALDCGYRSMLALPLTFDEDDFGVLAIYAEEPNVFSVESVAVLTELAGDLGYGATALRTRQRFRLAFENNMAPMVFIDLEERILAVNDSFCQMVGRSREELVGKDSTPFTHPEDHGITKEAHRRLTSGEAGQVRYVKRYLHKDGRVIVAEVSKSPARDAAGTALYFVASGRDVTEERALSAQLAHQALHDLLTGLANRVLFEDRLDQARARAARQGRWGAVLLLDLDGFKAVNDTLGHLVGDQLLVVLARRLEQVTRSTDTLCRFGGDEFLYLAEGLASPAEAEEVAERLLSVLAEPFSLAGEHLEQHASIGVVVFEGADKGSTELIQDADAAMYEAKHQGKGRHVLFSPTMHEVSRFELVQELAHSLRSGELSMHYQPIVDLTTTEVVGFEALMRWQHPTRGLVPPDVFIALAEQSDLIFELGSFALREATAEARSWERTGAPASRPYVSVNLSARQFHDPDLLSMIEGALTASGLAPKRLLLEITESVALADVVGTRSVIEHLEHLGVAVALDDFGTGYSSLAYLTLLRPRIIKIDKSFVSPTHESSYNDTLLEAIVSLGQKLNMTVLAEGIETQEQLQHLRHLGCQLGQGYLFSPAVPAGEVAAMLARAPANWTQKSASPAASTPRP